MIMAIYGDGKHDNGVITEFTPKIKSLDALGKEIIFGNKYAYIEKKHNYSWTKIGTVYEIKDSNFINFQIEKLVHHQFFENNCKTTYYEHTFDKRRIKSTKLFPLCNS